MNVFVKQDGQGQIVAVKHALIVALLLDTVTTGFATVDQDSKEQIAQKKQKMTNMSIALLTVLMNVFINVIPNHSNASLIAQRYALLSKCVFNLLVV